MKAMASVWGRCGAPVVAGDDDVNAGARLADVLGLLVVHLPQRVSERARGVDHTLGLHIKFLSCEGDDDDETPTVFTDTCWRVRSTNYRFSRELKSRVCTQRQTDAHL